MKNFFDYLQELYGSNEITPSIYRSEIETSFMDRYNRCLELNRESKNFRVKPSILVFQNYQNLSNLTLPFTILNTSRRQRPLNMETQKSNILKVVSTDYDLSALVPSESSITYKIQLNSNKLPANMNRDKYEEIEFNSINDRFQLPVLIVGRKTVVDFPDRIEFDRMLTFSEPLSKSVSIRNISLKSAQISIHLGNSKNAKIKFEPKKLVLGINETEQFRIDCRLNKERSFDNVSVDGGLEIDAILEIVNEARLQFKIMLVIKTQNTYSVSRHSKKISKKKPQEMAICRPLSSLPLTVSLNVSQLDFGTVFVTKNSEKIIRVTNDSPQALSLVWSLCTSTVRVEPQSIPMLDANNFFDFTVVFAPKSIQRTYMFLECTASEIDGDPPQKMVCKLTVRGSGLGPQLQLLQNRFVFCDLLAGLMKVIEVKIKNCGSIGGTVEFCGQLKQQPLQQQTQSNSAAVNDSELFSETKYCTAIDSSTFPATHSQLHLSSSSMSSSPSLFHTLKCYPQKLDLKPDEMSHVKLAFCIRKYGAFFEQLTFRINETHQTLNVILEGNVIEPNLLEHLPSVIDLERIAYGFPNRRELQITNSSEVDIPFSAELLCGSANSASTVLNQQTSKLWLQFLNSGCRGRFSLPEDPAAIVNELQFEPIETSISPYSALSALLTVTSNTVGVTKTGFILKTGNFTKLIQVVYETCIPEVVCDPSEIVIRPCYLQNVYRKNITIRNRSDVKGFFHVTATGTASTDEVSGSGVVVDGGGGGGGETPDFEIEFSQQNGILNANDQLTIEVIVKLCRLGTHRSLVRLIFFGSIAPCDICSLLCYGESPELCATPEKLVFDSVPLFEQITKTVRLTNRSPVFVHVDGVSVTNECLWQIQLDRYELEPHGSLKISVTLILFNSGRYADEICLRIRNGYDFCFSVAAFGIGYSFVVEPDIFPAYNFGWIFTNRPSCRKLLFTNKGLREYRLTFSHDANKTIPLDNATDTIRFEPNPVILLPLQSHEIAMELQGETIGRWQDSVYLHVHENHQKMPILLAARLSAHFVEPLLKFSQTEFRFRLDLPHAESEYCSLAERLEIDNLLETQLTMNMKVEDPFYLMVDTETESNNGAESKTQSVCHVMQAGERKFPIWIVFDVRDSCYSDRKCYRFAKQLKITYEEHDCQTGLALNAEINCPAVALETNRLDFGVVLVDSVHSKQVSFKNVCALDVRYSWSIVEDSIRVDDLSQNPDDNSFGIDQDSEKIPDLMKSLKIEPSNGLLKPNEEQILQLEIKPKFVNILLSAKFCCEIDGGLTHYLIVNMSTANYSYQLSNFECDFGRQFWRLCDKHRSLTLTNTCLLDFRYEWQLADFESKAKFSSVKVEPVSGLLKSNEVVEFEINYCCGLTGFAKSEVYLKIADSQLIPITLKAFGLLPKCELVLADCLEANSDEQIRFDYECLRKIKFPVVANANESGNKKTNCEGGGDGNGGFKTPNKFVSQSIIDLSDDRDGTEESNSYGNETTIRSNRVTDDSWQLIDENFNLPSKQFVDGELKSLRYMRMLTEALKCINEEERIRDFLLWHYVLDFGNVEINSEQKRDIEIRNNGEIDVELDLPEMQQQQQQHSDDSVVVRFNFQRMHLKCSHSLMQQVSILCQSNRPILRPSKNHFQREFSIFVYSHNLCSGQIKLTVKATVIQPFLLLSSLALNFGQIQSGCLKMKSLIARNTSCIRTEWQYEIAPGEKTAAAGDFKIFLPLRSPDSNTKIFFLEPQSEIELRIVFEPRRDYVQKSYMILRSVSDPQSIYRVDLVGLGLGAKLRYDPIIEFKDAVQFRKTANVFVTRPLTVTNIGDITAEFRFDLPSKNSQATEIAMGKSDENDDNRILRDILTLANIDTIFVSDLELPKKLRDFHAKTFNHEQTDVNVFSATGQQVQPANAAAAAAAVLDEFVEPQYNRFDLDLIGAQHRWGLLIVFHGLPMTTSTMTPSFQSEITIELAAKFANCFQLKLSHFDRLVFEFLQNRSSLIASRLYSYLNTIYRNCRRKNSRSSTDCKVNVTKQPNQLQCDSYETFIEQIHWITICSSSSFSSNCKFNYHFSDEILEDCFIEIFESYENQFLVIDRLDSLFLNDRKQVFQLFAKLARNNFRYLHFISTSCSYSEFRRNERKRRRLLRLRNRNQEQQQRFVAVPDKEVSAFCNTNAVNAQKLQKQVQNQDLSVQIINESSIFLDAVDNAIDTIDATDDNCDEFDDTDSLMTMATTTSIFTNSQNSSGNNITVDGGGDGDDSGCRRRYSRSELLEFGREVDIIYKMMSCDDNSDGCAAQKNNPPRPHYSLISLNYQQKLVEIDRRDFSKMFREFLGSEFYALTSYKNAGITKSFFLANDKERIFRRIDLKDLMRDEGVSAKAISNQSVFQAQSYFDVIEDKRNSRNLTFGNWFCLESGEQITLGLRFRPESVGRFSIDVPIRCRKSFNTYSIRFVGICDIPKVSLLLPTAVENCLNKGKLLNCKLVTKANLIFFGNVFMDRKIEQILDVKNDGLFEIDCELELQSAFEHVFSLKNTDANNRFSIHLNCNESKSFEIELNPIHSRTMFAKLLIHIRTATSSSQYDEEPPSVSDEYRIEAIGCRFDIQLDSSHLIFEKTAKHFKRHQTLNIRNCSKCPISFHFEDGEDTATSGCSENNLALARLPSLSKFDVCPRTGEIGPEKLLVVHVKFSQSEIFEDFRTNIHLFIHAVDGQKECLKKETITLEVVNNNRNEKIVKQTIKIENLKQEQQSQLIIPQQITADCLTVNPKEVNFGNLTYEDDCVKFLSLKNESDSKLSFTIEIVETNGDEETRMSFATPLLRAIKNEPQSTVKATTASTASIATVAKDVSMGARKTTPTLFHLAKRCGTIKPYDNCTVLIKCHGFETGSFEKLLRIEAHSDSPTMLEATAAADTTVSENQNKIIKIIRCKVNIFEPSINLNCYKLMFMKLKIVSMVKNKICVPTFQVDERIVHFGGVPMTASTTTTVASLRNSIDLFVENNGFVKANVEIILTDRYDVFSCSPSKIAISPRNIAMFTILFQPRKYQKYFAELKFALVLRNTKKVLERSFKLCGEGILKNQ